MIVIDRAPGDANHIMCAMSDDGLIQYAPDSHSLKIDGRWAHRRQYLSNGKIADDVPQDRWEAACDLMDDVERHNAAAREAARDRNLERDIERINQIESLGPHFAAAISGDADAVR